MNIDLTDGDIAVRWTFEDYDPTSVDDVLSVTGAFHVLEVSGESLGNGATVTTVDNSLQTSAGHFLNDIAAIQSSLALRRISQRYAMGLHDKGDRTDKLWTLWLQGFAGLKSRTASTTPSGALPDTRHTWSGSAMGQILPSVRIAFLVSIFPKIIVAMLI